MLNFLPPRLRAPVYMLVVGAIIIAVAVSADGWEALAIVGPFLLLVVAWYYLASGRDSDYGAMLRRQSDERQAYHLLKMQALTGNVMSAAAAIGYLVAVAVKATLWPFGVALGLVGVSQLAGWLIYREQPGDRDQHAGY